MQAVALSSKPALAARSVAAAPRAQRAARVARPVECSAAKRKEAMAAAVTVGVATMMANPLVAEAAVTPSLKNLLNSVVAGGVVLVAIAGAVTAVSNFDQLSSRK